jgi:N-acetylneuraminic acid mutarotase
VVQDRIYVIGGFRRVFLNLWRPVNTVYTYAPETDRWSERTPMPAAWHGLGSAVVGRQLYVLAGGPEPGGSFRNRHEEFRLDPAC